MNVARIPSISAIQRTNVVLLALAMGALAVFDTRAAALGCLFGGAVVIVNLYILAILGYTVLSAASVGGGGLAAKAGPLVLSLKLLIVAVLVYLLFAGSRLDALGFALGVLTQMIAVIIETGRAAMRGAT